jgi:two-component system, NarL family, nitrate/nitrite response regulator NarL
MPSPIPIAVIDPYPIFREGIVRTIARCADFVLVAQGETAGDAFSALQNNAPDILTIDINAVEGGVDDMQRICKEWPSCKVVILTGVDDALSVSNALAIGVRGYILKGVAGSELIAALKAIHAGQPFVTAELAARLLMDAKGGPLLPLRGRELHAALSCREQQVLAHISKGRTNREIAEELGVTVKTIKYYLTQLFKKLKVTNRMQAIQVSQRLNFE